MCLFVVDGTWSRKFNSKNSGTDERALAVGESNFNEMTNSRKFFLNSNYPDSKKFYYRGVDNAWGLDTGYIYRAVIEDVSREIYNGNCTELSFVGWSRGAAIVTEVCQALSYMKHMVAVDSTRTAKHPKWEGPRYTSKLLGIIEMLPNIKFLGLFDSVAMTTRSKPMYNFDNSWGEEITSNVDYCANVIAGDRVIQQAKFMEFKPAVTSIKAKNYCELIMPGASHGDVGGNASTPAASAAYRYIKMHAQLAGIK